MTDLFPRHGVLCHGSVLPVFCWVAVLLFSVTAIAVPSNEKPWTFHQPDGTPFQAILKGSEYYAYHETPEGEKVVQDVTSGYWHYAVPKADGTLERMPQIVGQSGPKMLPSNKELTQWSDAVERIIDQRAKEMTEHFLENEKIPPTGALRGVLLLANFSDTSTTFAQSDFNDLMNTPGYNQNSALGSVRDYYYEASYGALTIQIDVYGWVDLPETRYYYGHNVVGNDQNPRQMVIDAISAADSVVDFSYYDSDGDGWVDFFGVVHQGQGEEQSGAPEDCIWSHRAGLFSAMNVDGVQIQDYYTAPELYYARLSTIGVFCHEMGHVFNLPDLYATTGSSNGIGNWSLMGTGSWCGPGNDGSKPCHFDPWCKMALGWLRPTSVFGPRTGIPLLNLDQNAQALRIPIDPYQDGEYFLVCNRYQRAAGAGAGFDQYLPGSGALILHIDDYVYSNDTPARKKVDVEEADGLSQLDSGANRGNAGDLYPNGAASFTDSTFPNTKDNDGNSTGIIVNGFTGGGTAAMTTSVTPLASLNGKYIGYDETGASTTGHGWDGNDYGCVRFTTLSGGTLRRVKTYFAYTGTTDYTVSVFSGWSGSAPAGLLTSQSGAHTGRGYEEIALASPQTFAPNSEFCVQVQYDSHFMFLFVLPLALDWNCSGNSWVSADGVNYVHLAQDSTLPYDLNIRADLDSPTGTIKQDGTADFTNFTDAIYWANAMPGANTLLVLDTATYTESPPAITETVAIQGNGAALTGGFVLNTAGVAISNLTINGPAANHIDVAVGGASVTLTDCMLEGSSSNNLRVSSGASAALSGCTIRNASGHGISNEGGTLDLTNCTVYGNGGSGIRNSGNACLATVTGGIVRNNSQHGITCEFAGTSLNIGGNASIRDNLQSGIHITASATLDVTSSTLQDNGAYGVVWTSSATSNTDNTFADCTFQQQALRLFHIEDGCYVKRVELTNPVFSGKCGQDLAFYIGTGGVGSSAAGDGFRIVGTGTGSTRIDFDPMLEGGTQAVARVRKGDLVFVKSTGTKISADNAYWIDSRGATALGGEVKVVFDRCYWKNGAGSYWAGTEGGGSSGVIIEAVNTMWVWDTAADHNHGAVLNLGGNHTGASEIRLRHCTLKSLNNAIGYNLSGSLVRGNENFDGTPNGRGDILYGGWTIFDASGVTGAVDSTAGSNLSLTRYAGYPSAPCVAWRTIGFTGFGSVPGETINVSPNLASSGYLQDGVSYAAMSRATNSTEVGDIDGGARPLPVATERDIGAHESAYNDTTAPDPGTAAPPAYANTSPFAVSYNGAQDDAGGSGLGGVELWYKFGPGGTWTSTGLIHTGGSGVFNFVPANGEGTYYFALAAWDNFGNNSATPGGNGDGSTVYDITPPTVTAITPTTPSPTNGSTVAFAVNFSEVVAGFADASDLAVAETGTLSHTGITFAGGTQNYTVTVTGVTGNGTMTLTINTGSGVRDLATNNLASSPTSVPVTVDHTSPTVTAITPTTPSPTNGSSVVFTVNFSEEVTGFTDASDLTIAESGTVAHTGVAFAGGPQNYTVTVTGVTGNGTMTLAVNTGPGVRDLATNNLASSPTSAPVTADHTAPTVTAITPTTPSPTNGSTVAFTVNFSEAVTGFADASDLAIAETGTVSHTGITFAGGAQNYTVTVTGVTGDGTMTLAVNTGAGVRDLALNNLASSPTSAPVTVDHTAPTVTAITPTTPSPTNGSTVAFAVNFSEVVAGFADASDLAVAETGTLSHTGITFAGGPQNYTVTVTGVTGNGTMTLTINTGSGVRDLALNNLASSPTSVPVTVDQTFPAVSMTCLAPDPTNMTPIPVTVAFTRDVVGFDLSDVAVSNATKGNFQAIDPSHYGFDLTPLDQGLVSADIPSGVAQDAGGNANTAAVPLSRLFDSIAPAATLTLTTPSPTTEDTVNFDVVFSEPLVSDLAFDDVTLTGTLGFASGKTVTGTGTAYTVAVTPADAGADGTVGIAVQAGLLDAAGNQYAGGASALCTVYNWFGFGTNIVNARLYVGDTHAMSVSVVCGSGPLSYQWKWNDNLGKAVHLLGNQSTETIASATTAQRGEYWCEVTYSGLAQLSNLADISVEPHLLITQQPSGGDKNGGGTHVFRVQTTGGYQPLTYFWLKDGIVLPGQTSDSITLGPLQESDSGTYTVEIADNGLDSIESEPAVLTVSQGVPVVGVVGCAMLTLFCALGGATVLWRSRRNGLPLQ